MSISFKSKAECLAQLATAVTLFKVPDLIKFSVSEFIEQQARCIAQISETFPDGSVAIRSSASDEDLHASSAAGLYTSVLDVNVNSTTEIVDAIQRVIASYEQQRPCNEEDQIIVQRMVNEPSMSGVVFTHELNTGAPYYVINYDDCSGMTDTVTSGEGEYANRTLYVHRGSLDSVRSARFRILLQAIAELEALTGSQFLDIEFALSKDLTPYLFQVRSISTLPHWNRGLTHEIDNHLTGIASLLEERFKRMPGIYGETTVFSQMSDWNPAEIIGRAPRALSYSLYKSLITDKAWSVARERMGYATPVGMPLMVSLAGQPFIDTRLSFHSYLPSTLPTELADKIVTIWVQHLCDHPELHDKIEFDVAVTSYRFDLEQIVERRLGKQLSSDELSLFSQHLKRHTQQLIGTANNSSLTHALKNIEHLKSLQEETPRDNCIDNPLGLYSLIEQCINFGTVPFSILARHGFIAKTLLDSLLAIGALESEVATSFYGSIETVASQMVSDFNRHQTGAISTEEMKDKYGHLRPGTYDILSLRYDQMPDLYSDNKSSVEHQPAKSFNLSAETKQRIDTVLKSHGLNTFDADGLFDYCRHAIVGREYGKFVFTKSVSNILEQLASIGERHGLSRDEMSHIPLHEILNSAEESSAQAIEDRLRKLAQHNASQHIYSAAIRLPQVLFDLAGVYVVPFQVSQPNFISSQKVTAKPQFIDSHGFTCSLAGKVVLIENADPGFDWIFTHKIAGLVTKYGGANSHMAIRCAEFGIPAAIGCGEQRFDVLLQAKSIMLDAASRLVQAM